MLAERWERWAATAGVVFFPLVVVSIALSLGAPGEKDTVQKFATYFADNGNQTKFYLSTLAGALAGILFLWFLTALRSVLLRAEGMPGPMTTMAFAGGLLLLTMQLAAGAVAVAYPSAVDFFDKFGSDGRLAMALFGLSFWLAQLSGVGGTLLGAGVAAVAFRTGVLPRWLAWFTVLVAVGQLVSLVFFWPGLLGVIWVLVLAGYMLSARRPAVATTPAPSMSAGAA
jgi:hypothetical protein